MNTQEQATFDKMREALKMAIRQNSFDMLMTGEELRKCEFALAAAKEVSDKQKCWCETCRPITLGDMRMVLCPDCGNKRCPKATNHSNTCTNSNDVGQKGSSWEHVQPQAQGEAP